MTPTRIIGWSIAAACASVAWVALACAIMFALALVKSFL